MLLGRFKKKKKKAEVCVVFSSLGELKIPSDDCGQWNERYFPVEPDVSGKDE